VEFLSEGLEIGTFLSNFQCQTSLHKRKAPVKEFLATVLVADVLLLISRHTDGYGNHFRKAHIMVFASFALAVIRKIDFRRTR